MKSEPKNVVPFRLASISTDEFATFKDHFVEDQKHFDLGFDVDVRINAVDYLVGIFTRFEFHQKDQPVMILKCGCHFKIEKKNWDDQIHINQITLPAELITHLLVLTVGTARGIIHVKKPHWLSQVLLPTLNVSGLVKEDMVFNLDQEEEE